MQSLWRKCCRKNTPHTRSYCAPGWSGLSCGSAEEKDWSSLLILIKTCQTPLTFFLKHPFQNILVIRLAAFKYLKHFSIVLMLYGTNFECFFILFHFCRKQKKLFNIWLVDWFALDIFKRKLKVISLVHFIESNNII